MIEYINFTGGQIINSGVVPTRDTTTQVTFKTSTDGKWLFGSRTSYNATDTYAMHLYTERNSLWYQIASASTPQQSYNFSGNKVTVKVDKNYMWVNGTQLNSTAFSSSGFTTSSWPLYFGGINENGSGTDRPFTGQIYDIKIWQSTTLVRDFVPVVRNSDRVAGFYDKVENKFYTNAGTGSFGSGATTGGVVEEYQRVEYIENSGTQYINTGYYWTSDNVRAVLSANVTTHNQGESLFGNEEYIGRDRYFALIPHNSGGTMKIFSLDRNLIEFTYPLSTDMILDVSASTKGSDKYVNLAITSNGSTKNYGGKATTGGSVITNPNNLKTGVGEIYLFANHNSGAGAVTGGTPNRVGNQIVGK